MLLLACATGDSAGSPSDADSGDPDDTGDTGDSVDSGDDTDTDTADSPTGDTDTDTDPDTADTDTDTAPTWTEPCTTMADPVATGVVDNAWLDEVSGLAVSRTQGVLWVLEDHSGDPAVYALAPTGETLATVTLDATNNDWESLTLAPCDEGDCLFIGETGNNDLDRPDLGVYRIPEPDVSLGDQSVVPAWFPFDYPSGTRNSEALAVDASGLPVLLTKRPDAGITELYRFPRLAEGSPVLLDALGELRVAPDGVDDPAPYAVTDMSLWPGDLRVVIRTYADVVEAELGGDVTSLPSATPSYPGFAVESHGETISYDPVLGGWWQISEGVDPTIWWVGCAS